MSQDKEVVLSNEELCCLVIDARSEARSCDMLSATAIDAIDTLSINVIGYICKGSITDIEDIMESVSCIGDDIDYEESGYGSEHECVTSLKEFKNNIVTIIKFKVLNLINDRLA